MKKVVLLSTLFIMSCSVDNHPTAPQVIVGDVSMGVKSMSTVIANISEKVTSGKVTITMTITPGAMYSLQLTDIQGNIINTTGFTANTITLVKLLDYTAVPVGTYDLNLMDTSGNSNKIPVIIQR
jgi:hypothetical protein